MSCSARPRCWAGWRCSGCLAGLSTRRYPVGLEPVGQRVEQSARLRRASPRSRRRFVAATETALAELLAARVSGDWTWWR